MPPAPVPRRGGKSRTIARVLLLALVATIGVLLSRTDVVAQEPGDGLEPTAPPAVFLDCQSRRNCNPDQFRTEIDWVRWVREREDSDVHVIFTSQGVSGGGRLYTLDFVGRGPYRGLNEELTFMEQGQDVQAEVMDGLARTLRAGLLRYAVRSPIGGDLDVRFDGVPLDELEVGSAGEPAEGSRQYSDPWNYWIFQVSLSGDMDLRETRSSSRINPRVNADRVTPDWKVNLHGRLDLRRERRDLADGREVRDDRNDWRVTALVVRSVSSHFSVGMDFDARNSLSLNQARRIQINPAVEYNYYPYAEATRRQMIVHYSVGMEQSNYLEETMFGVMRETLPQHRLGVQYRAREEWGNAGVGIDSNQYLHDFGFYSLGVRGDLNYRILRGLEVNVSGSASIVNDNLHTPAGDISDEDILLGRQNLPSSYRYQTSIGFSYRWGSAFTDVVNTRFPRSVR